TPRAGPSAARGDARVGRRRRAARRSCGGRAEASYRQETPERPVSAVSADLERAGGRARALGRYLEREAIDVEENHRLALRARRGRNANTIGPMSFSSSR